MIVTDEMIYAALEIYHLNNGDMRAALEAAIVARGPVYLEGMISTIKDLSDKCDAQAQEIVALTEHKCKQVEDIMTLGQQVGKLEAELAELIEALKPFAEIAMELNDEIKDGVKNNMFWAVPRVGDLRRARAVLEKLGEKL